VSRTGNSLRPNGDSGEEATVEREYCLTCRTVFSPDDNCRCCEENDSTGLPMRRAA
jgi:hypothetical protein